MLHALYRSLRHLIFLSCTRILRPPENHITDLVGSGSNTFSFLTIIFRAQMGSESIAQEAKAHWPNGLLTQRA